MQDIQTMRICEADDVYAAPVSPERILVACVLERAIRDLDEPCGSFERSAAIRWFLYYKNKNYLKKSIGFTFTQCVEILSLTGKQLQWIFDRVAKAEDDYGKPKAERLPSRKRHFSLAHRKRLSFSAQKSTI